MTEETPEQKEQLWNDFLHRFPLESLRDLTLAEYNSAGNKDCFCYWLEHRTRPLGSIVGGSSFKFGVYELKNKSTKSDGRGFRYNDTHGWTQKYGNSADEAFAAVMSQVIQAAEGGRSGDLDAIDSADLWPVLRWKIAFLYQDPNNLQVAPVFSDLYIKTLLGQPGINVRDGHRELMAQRGEQSVFAYSTQLNQRIRDIEEETLTVTKTEKYLNESEFYSEVYPATKQHAGYETDSGLQLILELRKKKKITLYLLAGNWFDPIEGQFEEVEYYAENDPHNSKLGANAPKLGAGNKVVKVVIKSMNDLITLCETYTLADQDYAVSKENTPQITTGDTLVIAPHNQILYGPPGTGKTYETTRLAVRIAEPEWYVNTYSALPSSKQRSSLKQRYQELVAEKRIVFTTFHQSFSYEDFIEGIRAGTNDESGQLRYEVKEGIFKDLCQNADVEVKQASTDAISLEGRRIWKMSLGNTLKNDDNIYEECLEEGHILLGYGSDTDYSDCHDRAAIKKRLENKMGKDVDNNDYTLTAVNVFKNQIEQGDLVVVSDGNFKFRAIAEVTGDYQFLSADDRARYQQMRPVRWLRQYDPSLPKERLFQKSLSQMTLYELKPSTIDHQRLAQLLAPEQTHESERKPHVLIIDEINRGNISRIFGELITLLEPSKRKGAEDEQSAQLPYSNDTFTVPNNVYVIGTMNTADKSLAQMDLALRRRFSFKETLPRPKLLSGTRVFNVDLGDLLTKINHRIEALLDAEHMIGHAYFMPLLTLANSIDKEQALTLIFKDKILPLLQEYFFDDFERIGWVLNDLSKEPQHRFVQTAEASPHPDLSMLFPSNVVEQLNDDRRYHINLSAFSEAEAYQGIVV